MSAGTEPPLRGAAGRPLRGAGTPREPPGPELGRVPLCPSVPLPGQAPRDCCRGGSARLALSKGQHGSPATFVCSLFNLHGSRCDPDSPINPASVILFYSPPSPPSFPFSLAESRLRFGPFFCSWSAFLSPAPWPLASPRAAPLPLPFFCSRRFHHSNHLRYKTGAHWTTSSPSIHLLQPRSWAGPGPGSGMLPEHPLAWQPPSPKAQGRVWPSGRGLPPRWGAKGHPLPCTQGARLCPGLSPCPLISSQALLGFGGPQVPACALGPGNAWLYPTLVLWGHPAGATSSWPRGAMSRCLNPCAVWEGGTQGWGWHGPACPGDGVLSLCP